MTPKGLRPTSKGLWPTSTLSLSFPALIISSMTTEGLWPSGEYCNFLMISTNNWLMLCHIMACMPLWSGRMPISFTTAVPNKYCVDNCTYWVGKNKEIGDVHKNKEPKWLCVLGHCCKVYLSFPPKKPRLWSWWTHLCWAFTPEHQLLSQIKWSVGYYSVSIIILFLFYLVVMMLMVLFKAPLEIFPL